MSPIVNLQLVVKFKNRSFHSFKFEVALLRYIVFYCELGCDTSEPHVSYISRACSSLVRQPYYAPNCIILKISGLESILAREKGRWDGRIFYIDEYALIFLFSRCARCAQKRDCWEHELCRGVAVFVLDDDAVDGNGRAVCKPGFYPVGVHVVAARKQFVHSRILQDSIFGVRLLKPMPSSR